MATTPAQASAKIQAAQDVANAASAAAHPSASSTALPAGVGYQTYNPDGSVKASYTTAQMKANNAADIASGKDTPVGVAGTLNTGVPPLSSAPITPPATPTNTPVSTAQPSPNTANATPYTNPAPAAPIAAPQTPTQQAHAIATASGGPAPQNAGLGMSVANTATKTASANQGYIAPAPVVQAYTDATQKLTDDYNKAMSSQDQGKSLVEQYQEFTSQLGIPALNTQLMNMKNVIDGTEDDIRNEVTKAGGFATDSQVLAMTNARNKTMIQNYNNLLQTRSDMQQQVQTMVGLAAQDRQYASQQIDRQLNFDQAQVTFAEKALTNAQNSIQKSIDTYGAKSVLQQALATGDPTAVARINATMGNGFDLHTAALKPTLDEQMKMANIEQSRASTAASYSTIAKNNADIAAEATAKTNAVKSAASKADNTLTAVATALKQVSPLSSGTIGGYSTLIPGSPSKNLESTIKTVQSALALDQLAALKANSPNGASGLGAASDREGDWLASNVANLDVGQSTGQLKTNLGLVKTHYINYLTSLGYGYDEATGNVISP